METKVTPSNIPEGIVISTSQDCDDHLPTQIVETVYKSHISKFACAYPLGKVLTCVADTCSRRTKRRCVFRNSGIPTKEQFLFIKTGLYVITQLSLFAMTKLLIQFHIHCY